MTTATLIRTERSRPAAVTALVASMALLATGLALSATGHGRLEVEDAVDGVMLMLFPLVGALLVRRGDHTRIGALCCAVGLLTGAGYLVGGYAEHDWAGRSVAAVLGGATFVGTIVLLMNFLPLLFPDGHLPSRRWRVVAVAGALGGAVAVLTTLFMPGPVDEDSAELGENPLGVPVLEPALELAEPISLLVFVAVALLSIASLVLRWRRATGPTRRQVALLAGGFTVLIVMFLLDSTLQDLGGAIYGVVGAVVALAAVPAAIGLALLRS